MRGKGWEVEGGGKRKEARVNKKTRGRQRRHLHLFPEHKTKGRREKKIVK